MVRARPVAGKEKRLGSLITNRRQNLLRQIWTIEVAEQNRCVERFGHQGVIAHLGRLCKVEAHWSAFSYVAELVKSFDSPSFSKVLTTSATKLSTKFHQVPPRQSLQRIDPLVASESVVIQFFLAPAVAVYQL